MANVLLVDDSNFMRKILSKILQEEHRIVGEVGNGLEAVRSYEATRPDLVLMDIVMPEMDGIVATKEIISKHPEAKIIMCTSMGQEEKMKRAIEAGAKSYIVKPFQGPDVLKEIETVLGS
ncbi:MAG: response regulator [Candidatus Hydrothermarchaeales archaeon]